MAPNSNKVTEKLVGVDQTLVYDVLITDLSYFPFQAVKLICSMFFSLQ